MLDNLILGAVEEAFGFGFPLDAGAVLIMEVDGSRPQDIVLKGELPSLGITLTDGIANLDAQADGSARVALQELPNDHAFAHLRLTDNCVQFTTRRYCDNPLIVQGPGAGPEVTAAGVFSDLLRVAGSLGARL